MEGGAGQAQVCTSVRAITSMWSCGSGSRQFRQALPQGSMLCTGWRGRGWIVRSCRKTCWVGVLVG